MKDKKFTLITGASTGLGKAFAHECAKRGQNVLLVALPDEGLKDVVDDVKAKYGVDAYFLEGDLTDESFLKSIVDGVKKDFAINFLINNAGIGGTKPILDASLAYINNMILLNIRAIAYLTHQLLPNLKQHPKAYILNVSSLAGFSPMPFKTVYPASKAFVYSFSRSLSEELKPTNVRLSVLSPGPIITTPEIQQRASSYGLWAKMSCVPPQDIAQYSIDGVYGNKKLIIPGWANKVNWIGMKILPMALKMKIFYTQVQKEINGE